MKNKPIQVGSLDDFYTKLGKLEVNYENFTIQSHYYHSSEGITCSLRSLETGYIVKSGFKTPDLAIAWVNGQKQMKVKFKPFCAYLNHGDGLLKIKVNSITNDFKSANATFEDGRDRIKVGYMTKLYADNERNAPIIKRIKELQKQVQECRSQAYRLTQKLALDHTLDKFFEKR